MGFCEKHQDRETSYRCMKYQIYMCAACRHCRDREIYCKFRSECTIHYMEKTEIKKTIG